MGYSNVFGTKVGSLNSADLDVAFSETANGDYSASNNYSSGTIGNALAAAGSSINSMASKLSLYPSDPSYFLDRANQTGYTPAGNVKLADNVTTVQDYVDAQASVAQPTGIIMGPTCTARPAAPTGSIGVNNLLTALLGSWTGASTYGYQWYRYKAGVFTAIANATASTYMQQAGDTTFKNACAITAFDASGVPSQPVMSALTSTGVTAVVPTCSVAPTITPATSQPAGTLYSIASLGTWANDTSAAVGYQWTLNGVAITSANASTYTSLSGQIGGSISVEVQKTTSQGASAWVPASNSSTVSGTVTLNFLSAPAFPSTVQLEVQGTITNATTDQPSAVLTETRIYIDSATVPYARIGANPAVYLPHNDSWLITQSAITNPPGISDLAGHTYYTDQAWTWNGQTYTSPKSAGKTVLAAPTGLALTANVSGLNWQIGVGVNSVALASAAGGTAPYAYTTSINLATYGVTWNGTTCTPSGSPSIQLGATTLTITVTDAASGTATVQIPIVIAPAQSQGGPVVWDSMVSADLPFISQPSGAYLQRLGGQQPLNQVPESGGVSASGTIATPPTGVSNTLRFGKIPDPLNPARMCFYFAANVGDGETYGHLGRVEIGPGDSIGAGGLTKTGTTYYLATEMYVPSQRLSSTGDATVFQLHQADGGGGSLPQNPAAGPWVVGWSPGNMAAPYKGFYLANQVNTNPGTVANPPGQPSQANVFFSDTGGQYGFNFAWPLNTWVKVIIRYRGDPTGTTGIFQAWVVANGVTTQLVNRTNVQIGIATVSTYDYAKSGLDDMSGGGSGQWELRRSVGVAVDAGYTIAQVVASMP